MMNLTVPFILIILVMVDMIESQCANVRLLPNSVGLVVTENVNTPLSFVKCSDTTGTDVLAETYYCGIAQIVATSGITGSSGTNGGLFTVVRDSNTLLINTVGDWRVIYNAASSFNLQTAVGTTYRVTIGCTDASSGIASNPVTQDLLVYLTPNLQPTVFNYPGVIRTLDAKATPANQLVYTLTVSDPEGDFITHQLYTEPSVNYFDLDTSSGEIRTKVDLRTATENPIYVRVNVSDGRSTVGPFTVRVNLNNLNTRPDITNLPTTVYLREDAEGGLVVSSLTVVDPDIFTGVTSLTPSCSVSPAVEQNKFVKTGNVIRLTSFNPDQSIFDYETTSMYSIACSVSDGFLSSIDEIILVNISNVNDPPVFNERTYYCQLMESAAGVSACDLGLTIRDPEGNPFTTGFLSGNNSERFALTQTNNNDFNDISRLTFNIDYDTDESQLPMSVVLTVAAVDSIGATGTAKININIADANDNAPVFSEILQSITVDYNTKLGIVGSIKATDKDQGTNGEIDYLMVGINPPNYLTYAFALGTGEIQYAKQYRGNIAGSSAYLTIRATDRGSPRQTSTGTVAISFLATTTPAPITTTVKTTTTSKTTTTTISTTTTTEYNFFAHSENVALFIAFMVALLIAAAIAIFLCARLSTLGYCFSPNSRSVDPSDNYAYNSREGTPNNGNYGDGYRGKPDYFDSRFSRGGGRGRVPVRDLGPSGRPLPAIKY